MTETLSQAAARRIVLAAQGFADPKPGAAIDRRHLKRVLARLGLFQIDSVSVVVRAHYMPLFSRLGAYPRALVDEAALGRKRLLFEYWAHEASLLPVETYPLMRWRMERAARGEGIYGGLARFDRERAARHRAGLPGGGPQRAGRRLGLRRRARLGRLVGLERHQAGARVPVLGGAHHDGVAPAELRTPLRPAGARAAAGARGGAGAPAGGGAARPCSRSRRGRSASPPRRTCRDYFRMSPADADPQIDELVEAGTLLPVKVEGWPGKAFLHAGCRAGRGACRRGRCWRHSTR